MALQVFQLVLYAWYLYIVLTQLGLNWVLELKLILLYVGQERDGMRAILESYDSELATSEYSPQLMLRVKEAEDMLQKVQTHNTEMEVRTTLPIMHSKSFIQKYLSKNCSEHHIVFSIFYLIYIIKIIDVSYSVQPFVRIILMA